MEEKSARGRLLRKEHVPALNEERWLVQCDDADSRWHMRVCVVEGAVPDGFGAGAPVVFVVAEAIPVDGRPIARDVKEDPGEHLVGVLAGPRRPKPLASAVPEPVSSDIRSRL